MATTDHPAWQAYKAALARLAKAGLRMEAARSMSAPDLDEAEQAFREAMEDYDAMRERLAEPASVSLDGAPVPRVWLGSAELTFQAPAAGHEDKNRGTEPG